ncbi:capsid cement protein [Oerskovia paurometabola]|uniref:capsid cement protein n=1 Tax=Oerskovia paurometabola TaxID=162170 RepID=UPI00380DB209
MAKNEVFRDADHLTLPVVTGTKSGDPVLVGSIVGVAQTDRDADGTATVWRKGGHDFTVTGAITAVGQPVYIAAAATGTRQTGLTATAGTDVLFGYALATKAAGASTITVALARV